jgi:hypothetical protein
VKPLNATLLSLLVIWSTALTYCRVVAAKEKAGPGEPWFGEFIGLGWFRATSARGKRFARAAVTLLWLGPVLLILTVLAFGAL